ncbi:MAG: hypothetical protein Q7T03_04635 [Deltaproteobacteria bacterium]|nr:hypothetical protein [Deltaproteobacteria bacterium]
MKGKGITIIFSVLFLIASMTTVRAASDVLPSGKIESLNDEASHILDEVSALQLETNDLQKIVAELEEKMNAAQGTLKKVSIASREARRNLQDIKKMKPQLKDVTEQLQNKMNALHEKELSLKKIETQMTWMEDDVSGPLLQKVSEMMNPKTPDQI